MVANVIGDNLVVKAPKNLEDVGNAMMESHMISILEDHKGFREIIISCKQELILIDDKTG